ncbi:MAG: acylglycerol kinase family protein [Flavobacteriales bacterium]|nr:acylglycerol kinase family protein [Flavobacteriales bacterium]
MSSVAFIIKGSIRHIQGIRTRIREAAGERIDVTMHQTTRAGEAILLSERAIRDGANYVIAVGGDGMINEVVNGYMNAPEEIRNKVSLGVFSSGKGNDYVKSLRVSGDLTELFALIKQDTTKLADLGLVEFIGLDGEETSAILAISLM